MSIIFICLLLIGLGAIFFASKPLGTTAGSGGSGSIIKGGVNNPGYLVVSSAGWQGSSHAENQKFENFSTIQLGARAWYINLFNKVKKGKINNVIQMIDVLTPAGSENPENARNNYKESVRTAKNWAELAKLVFDFEANPDWVKLKDSEKSQVISMALPSALQYTGAVPFFS